MKINASQLLAVLFFPILISCKKEQRQESEKQVSLQGKLKSITLQNGKSDQSIFSYTLDGRLKNIKTTMDIGLVVSEDYNSNPNGVVTERIVYEGPVSGSLSKKYTYTYQYKNGAIYQIVQKRATMNGTADNTIRFTYDERNLLDSAIIALDLPGGSQNVIKTIKFNTAKNSSILEATSKTIKNGFYTSITIESLEYDESTNPFYGLFREQASNSEMFCLRNTLSSLITSSAIPGVITVAYAYDYSSEGLPLKKYIISAKGEKTLIEVYAYYE